MRDVLFSGHDENHGYSVRSIGEKGGSEKEIRRMQQEEGTAMYTRLTTWTNATNIEGGLDYMRDTAIPLFHQQRGYRGVSASVDRPAGTVVVLSFWDTEADRDASDSVLGKARDEASEIIGGTVRVEKLEAFVSEVEMPPAPGSALMVTPFSMDPAMVDENLAWFNTEVVPQMRAAPGFCSVRNLGDRSTGRGYVGTVWTDRAAMEYQAEGARARRQTASDTRGITFGEITYREIVLVDIP
jgi:heme-degrading monooxygenase HmoA